MSELFEIFEIPRCYSDAVDYAETELELQNALDHIAEKFNTKADNTACLIKNLAAAATTMKAEEAKMAKRRKEIELKIKRLENSLAMSMRQAGCNKMVTSRNAISFRKSTRLVVSCEQEIIKKYPEYAKTKTTVTLDKIKLKDELKNGVIIDGADLQDYQNLQIK